MPLKIGGIYRHVRRGSTYEVVGRARMQIGWETVARVARTDSRPAVTAGALEKLTFVVYRETDHDGQLWIRPESEFIDGRFEEVP